jgi:hypothetical protein
MESLHAILAVLTSHKLGTGLGTVAVSSATRLSQCSSAAKCPMYGYRTVLPLLHEHAVLAVLLLVADD